MSHKLFPVVMCPLRVCGSFISYCKQEIRGNACFICFLCTVPMLVFLFKVFPAFAQFSRCFQSMSSSNIPATAVFNSMLCPVHLILCCVTQGAYLFLSITATYFRIVASNLH